MLNFKLKKVNDVFITLLKSIDSPITLTVQRSNGQISQNRGSIHSAKSDTPATAKDPTKCIIS